MNILLTFAIALAASTAVKALTDELRAHIRGMEKECIIESGVEDDIINKAIIKKESTEDPKLMDYYYCVLKKLKIEDADGKIDVDLLISLFPVEKVEGTDALIKKCAEGAKGDNPSVIAYSAITCFIQESEVPISA